jgi:uncharacterized membrane protein YciS (DUF1049 family)
MESITVLFVAGLVVAGVLVTLLVRKDSVTKNELERERLRERLRRGGGRRTA